MQATLYGTFGGSCFALEHDTRQCASDVQPLPTHTAGHCTSYYADVYRMRHVLTCGDTPLVQAPSSTTSVTATTEPLEAGPSSGAAHRKVISTLCMWTIPHVREKDSIHHELCCYQQVEQLHEQLFQWIRRGHPIGFARWR